MKKTDLWGECSKHPLRGPANEIETVFLVYFARSLSALNLVAKCAIVLVR